jgi:hypothetical protein
MKFPSSGRKIPDMTEAELNAGIAKCDNTIAKRDDLIRGATYALVLGFAGGLFASAFLMTGMAAGAMFGVALGTGVACCCAVGFPVKYIVNHAYHRKAELEYALPARVAAREAEAAENERLRRLAAEEKFNAAAEAGLPLESAIKVKPAFKFKKPPETSHGFTHVMTKVFGIEG